jgi:hypothetical protein
MTPEERALLSKIADKVEENSDILHSMRRSMRFARIMSFVYWIFIIGSAVGAYYFIQPYLDQLLSIYGGASSDLQSIKNSVDVGNVKEILQNWNK